MGSPKLCQAQLLKVEQGAEQLLLSSSGHGLLGFSHASRDEREQGRNSSSQCRACALLQL